MQHAAMTHEAVTVDVGGLFQVLDSKLVAKQLQKLPGVHEANVNYSQWVRQLRSACGRPLCRAWTNMSRSGGYRRALSGRRSVARLLVLVVLASLTLTLGDSARAEEPTGREIVDRAEQALWGKTLQTRLTMTVTTPRWERTLELQAWMERPRRSFIRILTPAKEAGIGSLRIGTEMWNYLPTVERTIKIPPSMLTQSWMGSDFTNDDLVKESSLVDDYTQRIVATDTVEAAALYVVELLPKPDAAVVWGRIVLRVRKADFLLTREEFYDERGTLVRVMTLSDVRVLGGRAIPTKWELRPVAKPGNVTTMVMKSALYDGSIPDEIFTQRNLTKR